MICSLQRNSRRIAGHLQALVQRGISPRKGRAIAYGQRPPHPASPLGERVARAKPEPGEGDTDPGNAQMRLPASRGVGYLKAVKIKGKNR